jgi:hypothetical protein
MMKTVVIIGGGISGYMTANYLVSLKEVGSVVLVYSDSIPPIGVGEGVALNFLNYLSSVNIDIDEFKSFTKATRKYGVAYKGWWDNDFVNVFLSEANPQKLNNLSEDMLSHADIDYTEDYAIHYDCDKAIELFKNKVESNSKFSSIEGIASVNFEGDSVASIEVNGSIIKADYYVNCAKSGLFNEEYIELNDYNNSAITCHIEGESGFEYTEAKTMSAGWRWGIPLNGKTGYGYVYNDNFISDEDAKVEFLNSLGNPNLDTKVIKYQAKFTENPFQSNYATIGLAQSFLDPLDTSSIIMTVNCITEVGRIFKGYERRDVNYRYLEEVSMYIKHLNSQYTHQKRTEPYWVAKRNANLRTEPKDMSNSINSVTFFTYVGRGFIDPYNFI